MVAPVFDESIISDNSHRQMRQFDRRTRRIARLEAMIERHNDLYYNGGSSDWTDEQYDLYKDRLRRLNPRSKLLFSVGAPVPAGKKVKLGTVMGSLPKLRPVEVAAWVAKAPKRGGDGWMSITPKLDGVPLEVTYLHGIRTSAATRGNGEIGQAVTEQMELMTGIPAKAGQGILGRAYVKGECIIFRHHFRRLKKDGTITGTGNERNVVAGILNAKTFKPHHRAILPYVTFIAYSIEMVDDDMQPPLDKIDQFKLLRHLGFITVDDIHYPDAASAARSSEAHKALSELRQAPTRFGALSGDDPRLEPIRARLLKIINREDRHRHTTQSQRVHARVSDMVDPVKAARICVGAIEFFREHIGVLQDGIVIEHNAYAIAEAMGREGNGLDPRWARSVKLDVHEQESKVVRVKEVQLNYTKRRLFRPVMIFERPAQLNGISVTNCTLHNARYMVHHGIKPGSLVKVIRSGDVIPRIVGVKIDGEWQQCELPGKVTSKAPFTVTGPAQRASFNVFPKTCPHCAAPTVRTATEVMCGNERCYGAKLDGPVHFFTALNDAAGLGASTIAQLIDGGADTVNKILRVKPEQMARLPGWGPVKARKVHAALHASLTGIKLGKLMAASGFFNGESTSMGSTRMDAIVEALGVQKVLTGTLTEDELLAIDGIGPTLASIVAFKIKSFRLFWRSIEPFVTLHKATKAKRGKLTGKSFAFTKFRDRDLAATITANGGEVTDNVTAKTTVLFAAAESGKTRSAEAKGITIVWQNKARSYVDRLIK